MGPSGSGKTTLLNCLSGLDEIDGGRVIVDGHSIHELSDAKRTRHRAETMGFIFQAFNLIPVFTATENVELPLLLARVPEREARERARATLARVGLGHRLDRRPPELSGGEQQRVAIARALAGRPRLVWADEPTGNLDSERAADVMDLLCELHREGLTLVLVTHDPTVAARADRLITVRDGELVGDEWLGSTVGALEGSGGGTVTTFAIAFALVISLPFLYVLARRPVLRRLALRNAVRRPREGALVVLGSLLGAAIITGSMVVGDTMDASIRQVDPHPPRPDRRAHQHAGPRRAASAARRAPPCRARRHRRGARIRHARRCRDVDRPACRGRAAFADRRRRLRRGTTVRRRPGGHRRHRPEPASRPRGDQRRSRACTRHLCRQPDRRYTSTAGHVAGSRSCPAAPRDRRLLARARAGGEQRARLPEDLRLDSCQRSGRVPADVDGGGVEPRRHRERRGTHRRRHPPGARGRGGNRDRPRDLPGEEAHHRPRRPGRDGVHAMFTAMGSFGVFAGLLLLVNLFVMLAAERKTELGMARAVGMRRWSSSAPSRRRGCSTRSPRRRSASRRDRPRRASGRGLGADLRDRAQPLRHVASRSCPRVSLSPSRSALPWRSRRSSARACG